MPTKFGELWSTNGKNRTVFQPAQKSTSSDAHISEGKGHCPLKISQLVNDDQRLLMYTSSGMGLPQQFLTPEIQKLTKNLVYFNLYRRVCWGNCGKRFYLVREYTNFGI